MLPEEIKIRLTGTRTSARAWWARGVLLFAPMLPLFVSLFLSLLFMFVPRLPPFGSKSDLGKPIRLPPFQFPPGTHDSSEASRFLSDNSGVLRQNLFLLVILLLP